MSTIKSSAENLTLNADGANNDIIFQSNGSTKATLDQAGLLTATTFAGSGASLTGFTDAQMPAGSLLQVKQDVKTDKQVIASYAYVDVLSLDITPSSTSSKILVNFSLSVGVGGGGEGAHIKIMRGSTQIGFGDARGNRQRAFAVCGELPSDDAMALASGMYLDSPSSTSAITYKIAVHGWSGSHPVNINCSGSDSDGANFSTTVSVITLQEIAG